MYTRIRLFLLIPPFISSFFFLSNFQTLKIFVTLFLGTRRPRWLKLGTHMDNGWMYCVYRNQGTAAYLSLYFFIFLSLQVSNIKTFRHTFLRNFEAYKVETWYTHGQWVDVSCIPELGCYSYLSLYFSFFFLSNFQTLNIFVTLFSGTVRPRRLKLVSCIPESCCCSYLSLYFFLCSFSPIYRH